MTISDFVADLRAATPSNAAELAVPDQDALRQTLDSMSAAMATALQRQLKAHRKHLQVLSDSPALQSPVVYIEQRRKALAFVSNRMLSAQTQSINRQKQRFLTLTAKLDAMSPLKVLTRGYAMVQSEDGQLVRSIKQVKTGDTLHIALSDGSVSAAVTEVKENVQ